MNINTVFIPCAGKGTRMGDVGKKLPKPLWPLFETTLLEFQIAYFKRLGFEKFIINSHHLADQFKKYDSLVEILHEPILLGSGGSLHNLKRHFPDLSKILISNPDVIFDLTEDQWGAFLEEASRNKYDNLLLGLECNENEKYNELVLNSKNEFEKVSTPPGKSYLTYSGVGVVDLNSFPLLEGESSFFESVVSENLNKTKVIKAAERSRYWDFGTLELYVSEHLKVMRNKELPLRKLLEKLAYYNKKSEYYNENCITLGQIKITLDREEMPKFVELSR